MAQAHAGMYLYPFIFNLTHRGWHVNGCWTLWVTNFIFKHFFVNSLNTQNPRSQKYFWFKWEKSVKLNYLGLFISTCLILSMCYWLIHCTRLCMVMSSIRFYISILFSKIKCVVFIRERESYFYPSLSKISSAGSSSPKRVKSSFLNQTFSMHFCIMKIQCPFYVRKSSKF